jgi:uncharacterized protein YndB with AHSA1/START domain
MSHAPLAPIAPIRLVVRTSAAPAVAWAYLTEPRLVREWLTAASPVGAIGEPYILDFGDGSIVQGLIVDRQDGRSFAHHWAWLDQAPVIETLVTWTVRPVDEAGSEVELVHDGWAEAGADTASRDDHEHYWLGYLDDLRLRLEDAAGS